MHGWVLLDMHRAAGGLSEAYAEVTGNELELSDLTLTWSKLIGKGLCSQIHTEAQTGAWIHGGLHLLFSNLSTNHQGSLKFLPRSTVLWLPYINTNRCTYTIFCVRCLINRDINMTVKIITATAGQAAATGSKVKVKIK